MSHRQFSKREKRQMRQRLEKRFGVPAKIDTARKVRRQIRRLCERDRKFRDVETIGRLDEERYKDPGIDYSEDKEIYRWNATGLWFDWMSTERWRYVVDQLEKQCWEEWKTENERLRKAEAIEWARLQRMRFGGWDGETNAYWNERQVWKQMQRYNDIHTQREEWTENMFLHVLCGVVEWIDTETDLGDCDFDYSNLPAIRNLADDVTEMVHECFRQMYHSSADAT